jgi:hypothetical protein
VEFVRKHYYPPSRVPPGAKKIELTEREFLASVVARISNSGNRIKSDALREKFAKLKWQVACREMGLREDLTPKLEQLLMPWKTGTWELRPTRKPGMFVAGKRVKGAALEAHRKVVAKRQLQVVTPGRDPEMNYTKKGQPFVIGADGRARFIKKNPLTGWEDTSGMTAGTARQILVPLVKPGARETFEHGYRNVPVPIAIALRPRTWRGARAESIMDQNLDTPEGRASQPGRVKQYGGEERILQAVAEHAVDVALAKKLNSLLIVMPIGERPKVRLPGFERGSTERLSPFTMFVVLHRIGDKLAADLEHFESTDAREDAEAVRLFRALRKAESELKTSLMAAGHGPDEVEDIVEKKIYSRGVGTAAGRMGVAGLDYMSDLFAKYLLTGTIAYDPVNPPPVYPGEEKYRQEIARIALPLFKRYVHVLNSGIPRVVYDG